MKNPRTIACAATILLAGVGAVLAAGMGGDGTSAPNPAPGPAAGQVAPVPSAAVTAATDILPAPATRDPNAAVVTDGHGNIEKEQGETGGLVDEATDTTYFAIAVRRIQVASECQARVGGATLAPANGSFLIVDVAANMAAEKAGTGGGDDVFMPLVAEAFAVLSHDGELQREVASASAWGCLPAEELAPAVVNPGEAVSGKIVLDATPTHGTVIYDPEGTGGWSWPYGG